MHTNHRNTPESYFRQKSQPTGCISVFSVQMSFLVPYAVKLTNNCDAMIESSAVVACPIGANRYVGVWQSVPLTMCDLQGRILLRRRRQQVAELLRLDVGQRCATSAMRARWWFSAGRAIRAILNLQNGISG